MFRNESSNQFDQNTDVYAGVMHPYFSDAANNQNQQSTNYGAAVTVNNQQTANGEFSLEDIQQRLGDMHVVDEPQTTSSNSDVMPSSQTLNMTYQRNYSAEATPRTKTSTKTKVMVVSYVAVVLCLVLAVTLCAVSVSGTFANFAQLTSAYDSAVGAGAALDGAISEANGNTDVLFERATQLGYVDAAETNTHFYQRLDTRPAQNFQIESNWFDALCDWLNGVFGG